MQLPSSNGTPPMQLPNNSQFNPPTSHERTTEQAAGSIRWSPCAETLGCTEHLSVTAADESRHGASSVTIWTRTLSSEEATQQLRLNLTIDGQEPPGALLRSPEAEPPIASLMETRRSACDSSGQLKSRPADSTDSVSGREGPMSKAASDRGDPLSKATSHKEALTSEPSINCNPTTTETSGFAMALASGRFCCCGVAVDRWF